MVYEALKRELINTLKVSTKKQNATQLKRDLALLKYQKINALKVNNIDEIKKIDYRISLLEKKSDINKIEIDPKLWEGLKLEDNEFNNTHIADVANFLSYQRTYQELIERYNPGLTMTQSDKIKKTANRVGYELPITKD